MGFLSTRVSRLQNSPIRAMIPIVSGIRKLTLEKGSLCVMNMGKPSANDITLFRMNSSTLGTAHIPAAHVGKPITANTSSARESEFTKCTKFFSQHSLLCFREGYTVPVHVVTVQNALARILTLLYTAEFTSTPHLGHLNATNVEKSSPTNTDVVNIKEVTLTKASRVYCCGKALSRSIINSEVQEVLMNAGEVKKTFNKAITLSNIRKFTQGQNLISV
ncbi:LOW QUALITY PROTEIN: hypothetical protein U0070_022024, partial [Myodes glareolus]